MAKRKKQSQNVEGANDVKSPLLDASEALDLDAVERNWKAILQERENLEAEAQRAFRSKPGSPTPSAVIQSAEGPMLFPGLQVNNNGALSKVARAALMKKFPSGGEPPDENEDR